MHSDPNLTAIAIVFSVALICGVLLMRVRQPAIVGYILAGVILGPSGFGIVEETAAAKTLADLGVLVLLFLVGMELRLRGSRTVYRTALITVTIQIVLATLSTLAIAYMMGWPVEQGILLGFVLAVSSTAVTVKVLSNSGRLHDSFGRLTVGVLVVQDLAVVGMLLALQALNPQADVEAGLLWRLVVAAAVVLGLVRFLSRRKPIRLPLRRVFGADRQVVPIAALAFCGVCATVSGLLGLSTAFGAFLAGLVVGNSTERNIVRRDTRPIESVLLAIFFLSIGLLIDVTFFLDNMGTLLAVLFLATVIKGVVNIAAFRIAGEPWERSVLAGIAIGQIGEFAFVIAGVGLASGAIAIDGYKIAVAVIALSLTLGPAWVALERRLSAAEGLGDRLSRAEHRILTRAARLTRPVVHRTVGSCRAHAWFARRAVARIAGHEPEFWPSRLPVAAREPADGEFD